MSAAEPKASRDATAAEMMATPEPKTMSRAERIAAAAEAIIQRNGAEAVLRAAYPEYDGDPLAHRRSPASGAGTPAARWRVEGKPDPHEGRYDGERAALAGGQFTDDEVAYQVAMLMRGDLNFEGVLHMARDRIRWLSRKLLAPSRPPATDLAPGPDYAPLTEAPEAPPTSPRTKAFAERLRAEGGDFFPFGKPEDVTSEEAHLAYNEPLTSTAGAQIISGVTIVKKSDVPALWRLNHPGHEYTDQQAIDEFTIVNFAWPWQPGQDLAGVPAHPPEGDVRKAVLDAIRPFVEFGRGWMNPTDYAATIAVSGRGRNLYVAEFRLLSDLRDKLLAALPVPDDERQK